MDFNVILSLIAILVGLGFIIVRAFKGHQPLMNCLIASAFICLVCGLNIGDGIATAFASGFANMMRSMALFFCACTAFGKAMQAAGYANSIAYFISDRVNAKLAPTIIFIVTVLLAMGGMLIATIIIVYPIAMMLLSKANYSKRILPAASLAGFWTVTCCSPYIPSAANNILMGQLGTGTDASRVIGIAVTLFLFITIIVYMQWQVKAWQKKGIGFAADDEVPEDNEEARKGLPSFWESLVPIVVVLILYNVFKIPTAVSMMAATVLIAIMRIKKLGLSDWLNVLESGLYDGMIPAVDLSVMGGIGAVVALTPFYTWLVDWFSTATLNPYILCWGGSAVMAGVVGSSTSGLATLVPTIQPILDGYVAQGYSMSNMHRLLCLGSISLDSLPHNGLLMACCQMMHCELKGSYFPIFMTCTLLPLIAGGLVALPLAIMGL